MIVTPQLRHDLCRKCDINYKKSVWSFSCLARAYVGQLDLTQAQPLPYVSSCNLSSSCHLLSLIALLLEDCDVASPLLKNSFKAPASQMKP